MNTAYSKYFLIIFLIAGNISTIKSMQHPQQQTATPLSLATVAALEESDASFASFFQAQTEYHRNQLLKDLEDLIVLEDEWERQNIQALERRRIWLEEQERQNMYALQQQFQAVQLQGSAPSSEQADEN